MQITIRMYIVGHFWWEVTYGNVLLSTEVRTVQLEVIKSSCPTSSVETADAIYLVGHAPHKTSLAMASMLS
jgi:hypothetical protein